MERCCTGVTLCDRCTIKLHKKVLHTLQSGRRVPVAAGFRTWAERKISRIADRQVLRSLVSDPRCTLRRGYLLHTYEIIYDELRKLSQPVQLVDWLSTHYPDVSTSHFVAVLRAKHEQQKLLFRNGFVKPASALSLIDKDSIVTCIKRAGCAGVECSSIVAEYERAYKDLYELLADTTSFYCHRGRVWAITSSGSYREGALAIWMRTQQWTAE